MFTEVDDLLIQSTRDSIFDSGYTIVPSSNKVESPSIWAMPDTETVHMTYTDSIVNTDSPRHTGSDTQLRTRAGRIVKSVNRLIESMFQRQFF